MTSFDRGFVQIGEMGATLAEAWLWPPGQS
jgi:hypothetical protein